MYSRQLCRGPLKIETALHQEQKKTGKDKMTPFRERMVLVRRLDSFAQAVFLSCHPFTNLLSKIDKKMAGPPIFQSTSLLIGNTSQ